MLHVEGCSVMHQTQHVKTAGLIPCVMTTQPCLSGLADMGQFGGRQGVGRTAHASRRPRLDLHEHQLPAVAGHHVQLHAPIMPVAIQNTPAPAPRKGRGDILAAPPQRRRAQTPVGIPAVAPRRRPVPLPAEHQSSDPCAGGASSRAATPL